MKNIVNNYRSLWLCGLMIVSMASGFSLAYAKRLALVIGNNDYKEVNKLVKAENDAKAVADTLKDIRFDVTLKLNLTRRNMNLAIQNFAAKIEPGDEVVFFYAGHGIEILGRNYLLATDIPNVKPGQEGFVTSEAIPANSILNIIRDKGSRISIFILDACRNNPFPSIGTRSVGSGRGLARIEPPKGAFIMFSAGLRQAALDRLSDQDTHPNSVYTRKLLPLLRTPGLKITDMAKRLRGQVEELAKKVNHDQYPAYYDQIKGDYYFISGSKSIAPYKTLENSQDYKLWNEIKHSKNVSDYEYYLEEYPNGQFASVAKLKLKQLKRQNTAPNNIADRELWNSVKNSKDFEDFRFYLREFPKGIYASTARLKIRQLEREQKTHKDVQRQDSNSADKALWNSVKDSYDIADYNYYLQEYPNGLYAAVAKQKVKKLSDTTRHVGPKCGWYAISYCSRFRGKAENAAGRFGGQVVSTSDPAYPNFINGWYCAVVGPSEKHEARINMRRARRRGALTAYIKNACPQY